MSSLPSHQAMDADVIIIGAGMAGISAAERLQESGIDNILILEASSRVGGRMKSAEIGGVRVPLGAGWIEGIDPEHPELHPLYQLAQRCGGLRGYYQDIQPTVVYDAAGRKIEEPLRWDTFNEAYKKSEKIAKSLEARNKCDENTDLTVKDGLSASGWTPTSSTDDWLEWISFDFGNGEASNDCSLSLINHDLTGTCFTSSGSEPKYFFVTDPDGYEKIAECMADEVLKNNETRLLLGSKVIAIDWDHNDCISVTVVDTQNGSTNKYCAKYAISTVSIGVLQSSDTLEFIPKLPQWKSEAIHRFGFARYIHIIMEFEHAFWEQDANAIGYIGNRAGYFPLFFNVQRMFPEKPNILMVDLTGDEAERILSQPQDNVIKEIQQILHKLYPDSKPKVKHYHIHDWGSDPYFKGAFSHCKANMTTSDFELLASPLGNLYFSGEATSPNYYGFVHGAYFAGIETAKRILSQLK